PGGMKTYAHLGVLQALVKARIPVNSIVGIGWAAPIAALYAAQGQVFDAEWKMFKLEADALPGPGLLSKTISAGSVDTIDGFLKENFSELELQTTKISFACPVRSLFNANTQWINKGRANEALKPCMA